MKYVGKIEALDNREVTIEYYDCDEPILIGDYYLFGFAGIADVAKCETESEREEANENDRPEKLGDLTVGFWRNCHKIKNQNFDLKLLDY
jgi:hypothetical protein